MVRQAIYRSGQDVGGATGAQLDRIERSVRIGSAQELGWIDRKADKSAGASQLQGLSHGPARYRPQPTLEGLGRGSEERRVGKEGVSTCRSRWSPCHEKKKNK